MIDGIESLVVPKETTPLVFPNAILFTIEGGALKLHVVPGKEDCGRLLREKKAETREERYALAESLIEASLLPAASKRPSLEIGGPAAELILRVLAPFMPLAEQFHHLIYEETPGCDAFFIPHAPEIRAGLAVFRGREKVETAAFHSVRQGEEILRGNEELLSPAQLEHLREELGAAPMPDSSREARPVFAGFAAAYLGAALRVTGLGQSWRRF